MSEHFEQPATHAAWSPFFDQDGNFIRWVEVGEAWFEIDSDGKVASGRVFQFARVNGYDSGYSWVVPIGAELPAAPPAEILEAARIQAQERREADRLCAFTA